nr:DUF2285 domain-containing protein [Novosphingobium sp. CECT 9465]
MPSSSCEGTLIINATSHWPRAILEYLKQRRTPAPLRGGGCDFLADPAHPVSDGQQLWRADVLQFTILVGPPPNGFEHHDAIIADRLGNIVSREEGADGLHVTIGRGLGRAHLRFEPTVDAWGCVMLAPEQGLRVRLNAASWFLRSLRGETTPSPEAEYLSDRRRTRLLLLLNLFDARRAGASLRQLGARFIDRDIASFSAAAWSDASERKQLRRLLATADQLVTCAYRRLLRGE